MGQFVDGRYISDREAAILDVMVEDAKNDWNTDLNDSDAAAIRMFYLPVARRLASAQDDLGLILDSSQISHADDDALDLLCALIGVVRDAAKKATGTVTYSLDSADTVDHNIPSGSVVATNDPENPIRFVTTEAKTLSAGATSVDAPIKAEVGSSNGNVGSNSIVNFPDGEPFPGANVTNAVKTEGGADREDDNELRTRAQDELSSGARATAPALLSQTKSLDGVTDVSIFINDTSTENGRGHGLDPHSFELVVTCDGTDATLKRVSQTIMDTKAVGDPSQYGINGDALDDTKSFVVSGEIETDLPNGQTHPVGYSLSQKVYIYVDVDVNVDADTYEGSVALQDAIVDYIGGWRNSGFEQDGDIGTKDDVVHASVFSAVMSIEGVVDVNHVYVGKAADPTGTSNVAINDAEQAITDARDSASYLTVATTEV